MAPIVKDKPPISKSNAPLSPNPCIIGLAAITQSQPEAMYKAVEYFLYLSIHRALYIMPKTAIPHIIPNRVQPRVPPMVIKE